MLQKRMSFSATDVPPVTTLHSTSTSANKAAIDKIKSFGSKFSSMVTRQAAPTITKLTTQGSDFHPHRSKRKRNVFSSLSQTVADQRNGHLDLESDWRNAATDARRCCWKWNSAETDREQ